MQPATVGAADRCLVAMATHNYDQRINARLSIKLLLVLMWQFSYSVTQRTHFTVRWNIQKNGSKLQQLAF